jgi:hypothetical protein
MAATNKNKNDSSITDARAITASLKRVKQQMQVGVSQADAAVGGK